MKRSWIFLISFILVFSTLLMSGCGGEPENELVDKWDCIALERTTVKPSGGKLEEDVFTQANDKSSMVVKNSGKITIKLRSSFHNETIKGTWKYVDGQGSNPYLEVSYDDGKTIIVQEDQYQNCYIEIPDGDLFGYKYTFWRKK